MGSEGIAPHRIDAICRSSCHQAVGPKAKTDLTRSVFGRKARGKTLPVLFFSKAAREEASVDVALF